jgi:glutathione reductase (NADPH)
MFSLTVRPKRLAVIGAGPLGCELAQNFGRLGCDVSLLHNKARIMDREDDDAARTVQEVFLSEGMHLLLGCKMKRVEVSSEGKRIVFERGDGEESIEVDEILVGAGRVPNVEGLGLDAVGIALGERGQIKVDENSRTSVPWVFAVGDVTDRIQLTPVAIREGHAFADSQFGGTPWTVDYEMVPNAVFSHPPIAGVGMTESQARNRLGQIKTYHSDFRPMKNVLAGRNERSLYKLIVDASTDVVVGIHMIGPDAPEILQAAAIAVKAGLKKSDFDQTIALHPTMAKNWC